MEPALCNKGNEISPSQSKKIPKKIFQHQQATKKNNYNLTFLIFTHKLVQIIRNYNQMYV